MINLIFHFKKLEGKQSKLIQKKKQYHKASNRWEQIWKKYKIFEMEKNQ